jgi:hypothetical protein
MPAPGSAPDGGRRIHQGPETAQSHHPRIPSAREQLLTAIEDLTPDFDVAAIQAALQNVKDMRNELAHAYPPVSWQALHQAVETLLEELGPYKVKLADWLEERGVLSG